MCTLLRRHDITAVTAITLYWKSNYFVTKFWRLIISLTIFPNEILWLFCRYIQNQMCVILLGCVQIFSIFIVHYLGGYFFPDTVYILDASGPRRQATARTPTRRRLGLSAEAGGIQSTVTTCLSQPMYLYINTHVLSASWADAWASDVLETVATQPESDASSNKLTPAEQMRHVQLVETCQSCIAWGTFASAPSPASPVGECWASVHRKHHDNSIRPLILSDLTL